MGRSRLPDEQIEERVERMVKHVLDQDIDPNTARRRRRKETKGAAV
jgi:hypothetical protein